MQLEILLSELLKIAPTYEIGIYPAASIHPLCAPPTDVDLYVLDGEDAPHCVISLYETWSKLAPCAGQVCWSATAWRTLTWWPVYLSMLAVHCADHAVSLKGFGLYMANGDIKAASLRQQNVVSTSEFELIKHAGNQLSQLFHSLHMIFVKHVPLHLKFAQKLYTDYIAQSLIAINELSSSSRIPLTHEMLEARFAQWLQAVGLPVTRGFIKLSNGKIGLNRQVCCQYFRIKGYKECDDCTRIPMERRIELMCRS